MTMEPAAQARRWRSTLAVVSVAGLLFALVSGSLLLFFGGSRAWRDYWGFVHWLMGMIGLVPYAIYQLRHYLRVRQYAQLTHYRVGLHAFYLMCGTALTGLPLVAPLLPGSRAYTALDLAHIFFGFALTLLLAAHLTLVALVTLARAPGPDNPYARRSIWIHAIAALAICGAVFAGAIMRN